MAMPRSENMARIRGADTAPEMRLRRALHANGFRYRLQQRLAFGRPDIVFPRARLAVFVDGCFWHGCPAHYVEPKSREEFWAEKLRTNVERDRRQTQTAEQHGWTVLRLWEHTVERDLGAAVGAVTTTLRTPRSSAEFHWQVIQIDQCGDRETRHLLELHDPSASPRIVMAPCDASGLPLSRRDWI